MTESNNKSLTNEINQLIIIQDTIAKKLENVSNENN